MADYIVEFRVPIFIVVEAEDASGPLAAEAYATNQLDNQGVFTVIEEALKEKTSFGVGDHLAEDDIYVNEA